MPSTNSDGLLLFQFGLPLILFSSLIAVAKFQNYAEGFEVVRMTSLSCSDLRAGAAFP